MSSIIQRLQLDATNQEITVVSLLRTAKLIATKLGLEDALIWIDLELNGYAGFKNSDMPSYRKIEGVPKAYNPYHGWQPIQSKDSTGLEQFSITTIGTPLGVLERDLHTADRSDTFHSPYPPKLRDSLSKALNIRLDVTLVIGTNSLDGIVEAVRNLILDWSLELEKVGVLGDELNFNETEKREAFPVTQQIFNNSSIGFLGNASGEAEISVTQNTGVDIDQVNTLLAQISEIKGALPEQIQQSVVSIANEIEKEISSEKPNEDDISSYLRSMKTVCEGATGSVVGQGIIALIASIL